MKTCCIVVIGHVDHGKTSLVRALTGIVTDRLPEEKARGLSMTLGFAHRIYPSGVIDFVDAPGHADFIQSMISGATGAQAALVVVSMVDGIEAQTLEHLNIAGLLGISKAVIAVTKSDLLTPSDQAVRLSEISAVLSKTSFATAPLVMCSAVSSDGIGKLHEMLEKLAQHRKPQLSPPHSFLPIDRAFTLPGHGTIVTGTLLGQDLAVNAKAVLQPGGHEISIRSLQSRGAECEIVQVRERMAANLRGVTTNDISRGTVLCTLGSSRPATVIDAHLEMLPAHNNSLKHMQDLRVMFGTSSAVGQVRLFKTQNGSKNFAQLRFKKPIVGFAGQRAVLRRLSPPETIGGATFLDPQADPTKSSDLHRLKILSAAHQQDIVAIANALCAAEGGCSNLSDIARLARLPIEKTLKAVGGTFSAVSTDLVSSAQDIEAASHAALSALAAYHLKHPLQTAAPRTTLENPLFAPALMQYVEDALLADGQLRRQANGLSLFGHDPVVNLSPDQRRAMNVLEDAYRQAGLGAPSQQDLSRIDQVDELNQLLIDTGFLITLRNIALKQTLIFHVDTMATARAALAEAFPASKPFTTSQARAALGTSRRVIVPLMEYFDTLGMTIRDSDTRQIVAANSVSQPNIH